VGFTAAQAARLTGCSLAQLSAWARSGLVTAPSDPAHGYRLQDLVALRVVTALLDAGLDLDRIRRAVGYIVAADGELPPRSLVTDGERVWACRDDEQVLDALRNRPVAFVVAVGRMQEDVEAAVRAFDAERRAFVEGLHDGEAGAADAAATGEAASGRGGDANAPGPPRPHATQR
jgi:DNA-binding transcriptional MerR regulator